ncbi:NAD(P)H-binding protein [Actinophytocola gossypii]|uniref:NAD(P)H-binding protein n=1 Tax=Actinophytocola gossypii TaxID=2812003 RepID=A0ABT2J2F9_9PSEU|nr:NAD(P)H-binding protein [Actinophytocola gossypii]MCT2581956.1 NAD(P)H-binding protein [Actinophytocola gossypii]
MAREILVLQPNGKTGRRVVSRLMAHDVSVRGASRASTPPFDWGEPDTWPATVAGADAAFVVYHPDIAYPGAADRIVSFVDLARRNGVDRLVLLSGRGEHEAEKCEKILRESGADWTIVRSAWFTQNFSEGFLVDAVRGGVVALPAGDVAEPFVDVDDIADVVVAALTDDRHIGRLYEVTGPRLLTFADTVREIGEATGREITYVPVTRDRYRTDAVARGVPPARVDLLIGLFTETLDGRNAQLADGVPEALGRSPRDFGDVVRATAPTGVWEPV